ncbi:MAG: hypothetical protein WCA84_12525 [Ignavibacteriaceae bacterium]
MDQQSAIEEIALIKKVIEESREFTFNIGKNIILWGVLMSAAIFASYETIVAGYNGMVLWIWVAAIGTGWIISLFWGLGRKPSAENLGVKIISNVWTSCGIAMTILGFAGITSGAIQEWALAPVLSALIGTCFAGTAFAIKLRWVIYVGVAWWLGALLMFFVKSYEALPLFGIMMILFMVVPGFVFHWQWKIRQNKSETK